MDLCKRLSSVSTLNDYIELSQDLSKPDNVKFMVNMTTIMSLKKIRSLEIEFFNKCDVSGAAFKLFELMLASPPLKTWGLLGSELIGLLQYWLDAVRKHLISHHIHWWTFLKKLLDFIRQIHLKDECLSNILVEKTAECLLDLATSDKPDVNQRHEILHTFNLYCAESSREVRMAMRPGLEHYFVHVATLLATCGHAPGQLSSVECLLRWLQPRRCPATRRAAADRWLLPHLYPAAATDLFLQRDWVNFFQDARDFINSVNNTKDLVTSAICRKMTVGNTVIISGGEKREYYVDVNCGSGSFSLTLDPVALHHLGLGNSACETITVTAQLTRHVQLQRIHSEVVISIKMDSPPLIQPLGSKVFPQGACDVTVVVSSHACLPRFDAALRTVFEDKYQVLLDVNSNDNMSPPRLGTSKERNSAEQRFSHPAKGKKGFHSGIVLRSRHQNTCASPSTASTTSLAQLHDKLANLPYYEFTKEPGSVIALPDLSVVSENSENDIPHSFESASTFKLRRCSVRSYGTYVRERKSQSDSEAKNACKEDNYNSRDINHTKEAKSDGEYVNRSNAGVSALFAATIGSADETILNETIEKLKDKEINTDNLMELLVQEALQAKPEEILDSGINSGDPNPKKTQEKTQNSEVIEDTQYTGLNARTASKNVTKRSSKLVTKSTSDESNTEAINETPCYVNVRKRNLRRRSVKKTEKENTENSFDVKTAEDFFNQHFSENQVGDLIISPTLAKKINETSSETSDDCLLADIEKDFDIQNEEIPNFEIVECLNNIVDKVCMDFDKCSEILEKVCADTEVTNMDNDEQEVREPLQEIGNLMVVGQKKDDPKTPKSTRVKVKPKSITLKFVNKKKAPKKLKGKLKIESVSKMSTILETNSENDVNKTSTDSKKDSTDSEVPLIRKKRKLYSPKDDPIYCDKTTRLLDKSLPANRFTPKKSRFEAHDVDIADDDFKKTKPVTPNSVATCYKDIEKDREKFKRTRARRAKNKESPPSPKTRQMDEVFEKLKSKIDGNEKITLVDKNTNKDIGIYNFTSDSEDEDFEQKRLELKKRTSSTTVGSNTSVISTRRGRAVNKIDYTENDKSSNGENNKKPISKQKKLTKLKNTQANTKIRKIKVQQPILIDEKMRDAPPEEDLNTSFVTAIEDIVAKEPEPMIKAPQIETISDETVKPMIEEKKKKTTVKKKESKHKIQPLEIIKDDERTLSPLPGLLIETEKGKTDGEESLATTNLVQKMKKIYKEGPDVYNDTNTTQHLLLDNDVPNSPQINITEEFGRMMEDATLKQKFDNDIKMTRAESAKSSKSQRSKLRLKGKKTTTNVDKTVDRQEKKTEKQIDDNIYVKSSQKSSKSKVTKSSIEQIICPDDLIVTRTKSRSKSREIVLIDETETDIVTRLKGKSKSRSEKEEVISVDESERSVASEGINGHGDTDESPPNERHLKENMLPREIYDMEQTIKEYYLELNSKVNVSKDSTESRAPNISRIQNSPQCDASSTRKSLRKVQEQDYDISKCLPSIRDTESKNSSKIGLKTPSVYLKRLTPADLAKWLSSTKNTSASSFKKSGIYDMEQTIKEYYLELNSKVNVSKDSTESRAPNTSRIQNSPQCDASSTRKSLRKVQEQDYDISKCLPSIRDTESENSSKIGLKTPSVYLKRLTPADLAKWLPSTKNTSASSFKKSGMPLKRSPRLNRKSQISPINLADFMVNITQDTLGSKDVTFNSQSAELKPGPSRQLRFPRPTHQSSPISKSSKSSRCKKRRSPVAKVVEMKKRNLELEVETVDVSGTQRSSHVEEWLKNVSASCNADPMDASSEVLQNVIEKLDTTLAEIHQNTAKDFIGLFVEAQKLLEKLKAERRVYNKAATAMLTNLTQLIDEQFVQMDQRAEQRENEFMKWLRERASEVLKRDCRQKRAMVVLLREDATRAGRPTSPAHSARPHRRPTQAD